jgi:hypothetical protein
VTKLEERGQILGTGPDFIFWKPFKSSLIPSCDGMSVYMSLTLSDSYSMKSERINVEIKRSGEFVVLARNV